MILTTDAGHRVRMHTHAAKEDQGFHSCFLQVLSRPFHTAIKQKERQRLEKRLQQEQQEMEKLKLIQQKRMKRAPRYVMVCGSPLTWPGHEPGTKMRAAYGATIKNYQK